MKKLLVLPDFATEKRKNLRKRKHQRFFFSKYFAPTNQKMEAEDLRERISPRV